MSWQTDDGEHGGWASAEFPGGWFSYGSTVGGAMVNRCDPVTGRWEKYDTLNPLVRDGRTAVGWRGLCECGWRGELSQRVDHPEDDDRAARRVYEPDPSPYGDPPDDVKDAIHAEWKAHLVPVEALATIREETAAVAAAQGRLTDAVRAARRAGLSWTDIGRAAGITRQSARERWSKHIGDNEDQDHEEVTPTR